MNSRACIGLGILVSLLCAPFISAQTAGTGALTGMVTDSTGGRIPGVQVTATNTGNRQTRVTTTIEDGSYRFSLLQPGVYSVKFEARGFAVLEVPSVQINVTETPVLNRSLNIGSETQTLTVEAEAEIIQTASSTVGNIVASTTVALKYGVKTSRHQRRHPVGIESNDRRTSTSIALDSHLQFVVIALGQVSSCSS